MNFPLKPSFIFGIIHGYVKSPDGIKIVPLLHMFWILQQLIMIFDFTITYHIIFPLREQICCKIYHQMVFNFPIIRN